VEFLHQFFSDKVTVRNAKATASDASKAVNQGVSYQLPTAQLQQLNQTNAVQRNNFFPLMQH
jgi:hypothetical protein